jgi:hypothetical protein
MASQTFVKLPEKAADVIESDLSGWKKAYGEPTMKTWIEYNTEEALCEAWEGGVCAIDRK